jgi:hypothetical protein
MACPGFILWGFFREASNVAGGDDDQAIALTLALDRYDRDRCHLLPDGNRSGERISVYSDFDNDFSGNVLHHSCYGHHSCTDHQFCRRIALFPDETEFVSETA